MSDIPDITFANSTTTLPTPVLSPALGYVAIFIAATFFGSNFLPVKKFATGNGIFFQWVLCAGIWTTGLITTAIRNFPQFYPLAMLGGFVWCTGNLMCVPAINLIGMAKGILLWGSFNLMMGWASSRFGWFGLNSQVPRVPWMNYLGVALCLLSACMYLLTKTSGNDTKEDVPDEGDAESTFTENIKPNNNEINNNNNISVADHDNGIHIEEKEDLAKDGRFVSIKRFKDRISKNKFFVKAIGSFMACAAGGFFGLTFTPVIYIKDNYIGASKNGLDQVFAHFTGIYIASTFYFLLYCALSKNSPTIYPKVALPGFISGLMWGVACIGWFIANDVLSEAVSYPIVTTLPGIIATMWGLLFREVQGIRNYIVLFMAISVGMAGSIVTGFSK